MLTSPKANRGFTIVELLIVVVVIAILAAVTIVSYNGIQDRAHNTIIEQNLSNTVKALELFNIDNSRYPSNSTDYATVRSTLKLTGTKGNTLLYCIDTANPTTWTLMASRYPSRSSVWTSAGQRDNNNAQSVGSGTTTCQTVTGNASGTMVGVWASSIAAIQ